ncbi:NfeD family protein [Akkermansiaceae bacterium]|nr:NfeD family protein [Akkermansiaceae bacterium]
MLHPAFIWFVIGIILFVIEFLAPALIVLFFGMGAWVVAIAAIAGMDNVTAQVILFSIASLIFLFSLRKYAQKWFKGDSQHENADVSKEFIGKEVVVIKAIPGGSATGTVELKGANWNAVSKEPIEVDSVVRVISRDGLTFAVEII